MNKSISKIELDIDIANEGFEGPDDNIALNWLDHLFSMPDVNLKKLPHNKASISFNIIGLEEMQALNLQYRKKDKPTNVLAFPCEIPNVPNGFLGDIVLCAPQIELEAKQQGKDLMAHWAHLMLHGTLHLLGYDHETKTQASEMESLEIAILQTLDFPNPYGASHER